MDSLPSTRSGLARATVVGIVACSVLNSLSCNPGYDTVQGQVFIVTQSRENVKLGLVTVQLIGEAVVQRHIALREAEYQKEIVSIREQNERAVASANAEHERAMESAKAKSAVMRSELSRAEARLVQAKKQYLEAASVAKEADKVYAKAHMEGLLNRGSSPGSEPAPTELAERDKKANEAKRAAEVVRRFAATCESLHARIPVIPAAPTPETIPEPELTSAFYFEMLPAPAATSQTDADGRFSLAVPRNGKFVLAARAERRLMGRTEEYFWLVRLPDDARTGVSVLLGNTTLTTAHSPLSLIQTEQ